MPRAYTERFLHVGPLAGTTYFTVPVGHRAVVRSLAARNDASTAGNVVLIVAEFVIYQVAIPAAAGSSATYETRQVAYATERVGLSISGSVQVMLSGYLFEDSVGKPALVYERSPASIEELPAPGDEPN